MNVIKGYDFDDVLLVPRRSSVNSRDEVDLSFEYKNLYLPLPIIASPMKGIVGKELIQELAHVGGLGILHRFFDKKSEWMNTVEILSYTCLNFRWGFSIGLDTHTDGDILFGIRMGARILCIDVANGYTNAVVNKVKDVKKIVEKFRKTTGIYPLIMAGNVVTLDGAVALSKAGCDLIRVGIGSGGLCSTRNVTGVGYPQLSAVDECSKQKEGVWGDYRVVSDGGIRNAADITKALACGADLVMIGSLFATCLESENNGIIYGMASRKLQEEYFHNTKSVEGIEKRVEKTKKLSELIKDLKWNMQSAYTYIDAKNTHELQVNAKFISTGKGTLKDL